jgi:hypothetical protein
MRRGDIILRDAMLRIAPQDEEEKQEHPHPEEAAGGGRLEG